jgi:PAS domain S-box-containing protein
MSGGEGPVNTSSDKPLEAFRLIVDQAPDAIVFADAAGIIQVWNKAATDLFGYRSDEAIGQSLDIIIPAHLRKAHWEGFREAIATGHTKHARGGLKTRALPKDGQKLYVSLAFSVVKDRTGRIIGATAMGRPFVVTEATSAT